MNKHMNVYTVDVYVILISVMMKCCKTENLEYPGENKTH